MNIWIFPKQKKKKKLERLSKEINKGNPEYRKKYIATKVLKELEVWVVELNYSKSILETGEK